MLLGGFILGVLPLLFLEQLPSFSLNILLMLLLLVNLCWLRSFFISGLLFGFIYASSHAYLLMLPLERYPNAQYEARVRIESNDVRQYSKTIIATVTAINGQSLSWFEQFSVSLTHFPATIRGWSNLANNNGD